MILLQEFKFKGGFRAGLRSLIWSFKDKFGWFEALGVRGRNFLLVA